MLGSQHRSYKWQVRRQRGAFLAEEVWPVQDLKVRKSAWICWVSSRRWGVAGEDAGDGSGAASWITVRASHISLIGI